MEKLFRPRHGMLLLIVALHLGLLALVLARPSQPNARQPTYIDLVAVHQPAAALPAPSEPPRKLAPRRPVPAAPQAAAASTVRVPADAPKPEGAVAPAVAAVEAPEQPDTAPPDFAVGKAPIDIDKMRRQVAINERDREKTVTERTRAEEMRRKSVESAVAAAAKAGSRKDCQAAYAGMGILAIIPLLASTVADTGCKWK